jgi:hypothetical protein
MGVQSPKGRSDEKLSDFTTNPPCLKEWRKNTHLVCFVSLTSFPWLITDHMSIFYQSIGT